MSAHWNKAIVTLGLTFALVALPAIAVAAPGDATVVSTRTETVNGVEIAGQIMKSLDHVAVGSSGATFTLDVNGAPRDIGLDLSEAGSGIMQGKGSGLGGLAIISAIAAGLLKAAGMIVHLLR